LARRTISLSVAVLLVGVFVWSGPAATAADSVPDCEARRRSCEAEHERFSDSARAMAGSEHFFDWEFGLGGVPLCDYLYAEERCDVDGYLDCMEPAFGRYRGCLLAANSRLASDPESADPSECALTLQDELARCPGGAAAGDPAASFADDPGGEGGGGLNNAALVIAVILVLVGLGIGALRAFMSLRESARVATGPKTPAKRFRRHLESEARYTAGFEPVEPDPPEPPPPPPAEARPPPTEESPPAEQPPPPPSYGLAGSVELAAHPGRQFTEAYSNDRTLRMHIPTGTRAKLISRRPDWALVEVEDHGWVWVRSSDLGEIVPPSD
jgi:hypothetical protein